MTSERKHTAGLYAAVALGSMIGGVLRAVATPLVQALAQSGFPWGTLFVNVTGSFAIGFYAVLSAPEGRAAAGPHWRLFVMTGLCGGYTTFSAFSLETFRLAHDGRLAAAGLNIGGSLVGWLLAVWLGNRLATRLGRRRGS
jgi:CrcB protein